MSRGARASTGDAQQQTHPELGDALLVQHLDTDARVRGHSGRGPASELPRRQRIARLVGQLARQIAALARAGVHGQSRPLRQRSWRAPRSSA